MQNAKRKIFMIVLVCAGFISVASAEVTEQAPKEKQPSTWELIQKARQKQPDSKSSEYSKVSELLDKFSENRSRVQSYIAKFEISRRGLNRRQDISPRILIREAVELRSDGHRTYRRSVNWNTNSRRIGINSLEEKKKTGGFGLLLYDGKMRYSYARHSDYHDTQWPHMLRLYPNHLYPNAAYQSQNVDFVFRKVHGFLLGHDQERVDNILRRAEHISVRPQTERVGDSDCYVIEGDIESDTKHRRYVLWIDPKHGYNIAKAEIVREEGDMGGRNKIKQGRRDIYSLRFSDFLEVDGEWVPKELHFEMTSYGPDNWKNTNTIHYKLNEFNLNPDHDALNSFGTDEILNGSSVHIMGVDGIKYIWQDGKVVDASGKIILDCSKRISKEENNDAKQ